MEDNIIYTNYFLDEIKNRLKLLYFNFSKSEIITYCPFCEGITGKRHGHLYISSNRPVFICHRCGKKGTIFELLKEIRSDIDLNILFSDDYNSSNLNILRENKEESSNTKTSTKETEEKRNVKIDLPLSRKVIEEKITFLKKRMGIEEEKIFNIPRLVLKPSIFLSEINLNINYLKFIDNNYIGFMSDKNKYMYLRAINNGPDKKHLIFTVNKTTDRDYYTIKNRDIDFEYPLLILSEGIFDILVPYLNGFIDKILDNRSYNFLRAVFGKGNYLRAIESFILEYCTPKLDILILGDSDFFISDIKKYIKNSSLIRRCYILYNKLYKDFGDIEHITHNNYIKINLK